ncbi:MAG: glycosyltransferase [Deltaproteobacteria bacterium]|nr:MAG: glycosyltransferase [Deltaproteobacteria bacterium]
MATILPLVAMARLPIEGQVKTRLAQGIGEARACAIYRACVEHLVGQLLTLPPPAHPVLAIADAEGVPQARRWLGSSIDLWQQPQGPLGDRLQAVFDRSAREGWAGAIVLATDTPDLDTAILSQALSALQSHDAVIGPAHDGGYYLLGLRRCPPAFFSRVPWSSDQVLSTTLERLSSLGWSCMQLAPLADLDTAEDLKAWRSRCPDPPEDLRILQG